MDKNNDGKISFGEFVQALWPFHANDKSDELMSAKDPIQAQTSFMSTTQRTNSSGRHNDSILEGPGGGPPKLSVYEKRTKMAVEFGAMIPDKKVNAQPDIKVLRFLR